MGDRAALSLAGRLARCLKARGKLAFGSVTSEGISTVQNSMQDWPLTVDRILDHAKAWFPDTEAVSRSVEGPIVRTTYAKIHERSKRLSNALLKMGVKKGDRIATMAWNTANHMECWYGIMGIGAICHTLNPRLFA